MFDIAWLDMMFEIAGIVVISFILVFLLQTCLDTVRWMIDHIKYKHKIEHRFDKDPKADCYCMDCQHWQRKDNYCNCHRWHTADNWFCWDAKRRKVEVKEPEFK